MHGMIATTLTSSDWMIVLGILAAWGISAALVRRSASMSAMAASSFGLAASIYLIRQKYSDVSICSGENTSIFNCDAVNQSEYSAIGPLPVATLGAAFFLAVLFVSWRARSQSDQHPRFPQFLFLSGLTATAASLVMAFISFGVIGAVCPFCVSLYGLSLILLWNGWQAKAGAAADPTEHPEEKDASLSSASLAFVLGLVLLYGYFSPSADVEAAVGGVVSDIELSGAEPAKGPLDAPYTVLEFADFQCPGCARLHPEMDALIRENEDIRLVFKNFPLEMHPHARRAAEASICAQEQGKFWEMSDEIFENQVIFYEDGHDPAKEPDVALALQFLAGPQGLQLNTAAFTACMNKDETAARVQADIDLAERLGLPGTPALLLHGVCGPGAWIRIENGKAGIEAAVRAHRVGQVPPDMCGEQAASAQ
jgi:protein-disulfide isomerase